MKTDLVPEATIKPNLKYEIKKKKGDIFVRLASVLRGTSQ